MDSLLQSNELDKGIAVAKAAIETSRAADQRPSDELYVRPIQKLQAAKRNSEVLDLMTLRLRDYNQPQVWRQALFILLQQSGDSKEVGLDILRLMRATNSMLQRPEYLEYAALATEAALPGEVVALIKEGKASKVIADPDAKLDEIAKAQAERMGDEESTLTAYAAKPSTLSVAKTAGATGDAMVGYRRYADAIPLYKAAIAAGGDKELWTYRMGVAQALSGDAAGAKASFAQVTGQRKRLADLWVVKLDAPAAAPADVAAPSQLTPESWNEKRRHPTGLAPFFKKRRLRAPQAPAEAGDQGSTGIPASCFAVRIVSEVLTLVTLGAEVRCAVRNDWKLCRSRATTLSRKSISPLSI